MMYLYEGNLPFTIIEEEKDGDNVFLNKVSQFRNWADVLKAFNEADHFNHIYKLIVPNNNAYKSAIELDSEWLKNSENWCIVCSSDHLDKSINSEKAFKCYERRFNRG